MHVWKKNLVALLLTVITLLEIFSEMTISTVRAEDGKENSMQIEEIIEETPVSKEAEYLELAQRLKAEFENYKKRL